MCLTRVIVSTIFYGAGERLAKDSQYIAMSKEAYNRAPDYYVITRDC